MEDITKSSIFFSDQHLCYADILPPPPEIRARIEVAVVNFLKILNSPTPAISTLPLAAVAHSFGKSINVYDQDIHLRTFRTLWYPTSLSFISNLYSGNESSILAVTEGCQLAIWDLRLKENGGCVQELLVLLGIFYMLCATLRMVILQWVELIVL